jgi:nitroimidazol reductase NimA-like FMN-containing flavoprotein (pyridoxamine 5'-phosphate oxidase superfamily)
MSNDAGTRLAGAKLDEFLALGVTARLSCLDERGWPYTVPVWHQWDGERFWVIAARHAAWVRFIKADPKVALCIDEPESLRRVLCQGIATIVEGPSATGSWQEIARQMAARYLGDATVPGYETATAGYERWLIRVDVDRLLTWNGPGKSEGERTPAVS